jgi:cytochrome P450
MSGKASSRPSTTESKCPVTHIGSSFDPFDGDPYDFYSMARREEPIFYNPQLGYWVVTRYNDVQQIFSGQRNVLCGRCARTDQATVPGRGAGRGRFRIAV